MSALRSRTAAVVAGSLVVVALGATTATAGRLVGSKDIAKDAVTSKAIKNGTVKKKDLGKSLQKKIDAAGVAGKDGKDGVVAIQTATLAKPAAIEKIGGPINDNNTNLNTSVTLQPGTYLVNVSGSFSSSTAYAGTAEVHPQLSLWLDRDADGKFDWKKDEGSISPNALMPVGKNRHVSTSGQTVITLTAATKVGLVAHGYASDESAARSGEINVDQAVLSATKLG